MANRFRNILMPLRIAGKSSKKNISLVLRLVLPSGIYVWKVIKDKRSRHFWRPLLTLLF